MDASTGLPRKASASNQVKNYLAVLCGAFFLTASGSSVCHAVAGNLRPLEPVYDFGEIGIDFDLTHVYKFVNTGRSKITIDSAKVTCDCSRIYVLDAEALPGDTASIQLHFNTKDWYGKVSKAIAVYTSELGSEPFEIFYLATVGQWYYNFKPNPINLFFLPAHKSKKLTIHNPLADKISLVAADQQDTLYTISPLKPSASKGNSIEIEVLPRPSLKSGTFASNFRLAFSVTGAKDTLFMSMPVKIVRY